MAFALREGERVGKGLKRLLVRELSRAGAALAGADPERAVHRARQRLKRARTLAWLMERRSPAARSLRRRLRDIAHDLAGAREAQVIAATAAALLDEVAPSGVPALAAMAGHPRSAAGSGRARVVGTPLAQQARPSRESVRRLRVATASARKLRVPDGGKAALRRGFERVQHRGRRLLAASERGDAAALHEWRKSVQRRMHLVAMLKRRDTNAGRLGRALGVLAELLGRHNDLALLSLHVQRASLDPPALAAVQEVIQREQARLRQQALSRGDTLYRSGTPGPNTLDIASHLERRKQASR